MDRLFGGKGLREKAAEKLFGVTTRRKYSSSEVEQMKLVHKAYTVCLVDHPAGGAKDIDMILRMDDVFESPLLETNSDDYDLKTWEQHLGFSGALSNFAHEMIGEICEYQRTRKTERNIIFRGRPDDPRNLVCEELKDWMSKRLSNALPDQETLDTVLCRIEYVKWLDTSGVFAHGAAQKLNLHDYTMQQTLGKTLRTLTVRVKPFIEHQISNERAREQLGRLEKFSVMVAQHALQLSYFAFRESKKLPRNPNMTNMSHPDTPGMEEAMSTPAGQMLQTLVRHRHVRDLLSHNSVHDASVIPEFKARSTGEDSNPFVVSERERGENESCAPEGMRGALRNKHSGLREDIRKSDDAIEAFVTLHSALLGFCSVAVLIRQASALAGLGGDYVVYGAANDKIAKLLHRQIQTANLLDRCVQFVLTTEKNLFLKYRTKNPRKLPPWNDNHTSFESTTKLFNRDMEKFIATASEVTRSLEEEKDKITPEHIQQQVALFGANVDEVMQSVDPLLGITKQSVVEAAGLAGNDEMVESSRGLCASLGHMIGVEGNRTSHTSGSSSTAASTVSGVETPTSGALASTTTSDDVATVNPSPGSFISLEPARICSMCHASGREIWIGSDGYVTVVHVNDECVASVQASWLAHQGGSTVGTICAVPGKDEVWSGGSDGAINTWSVAQKTLLKSFKGHFSESPSTGVRELCAVPGEGQTLMLSMSTEGAVDVWSAETTVRTGTLNVSDATAICVHGKSVWVGTAPGLVRVFHSQTRKEIWQSGADSHSTSVIALQSDSEDTVWSASASELRMWKQDKAKKKHHVRLGGIVQHTLSDITCIATTRALLITGCADGSLVLFNSVTLRPVQRIKGKITASLSCLQIARHEEASSKKKGQYEQQSLVLCTGSRSTIATWDLMAIQKLATVGAVPLPSRDTIQFVDKGGLLHKNLLLWVDPNIFHNKAIKDHLERSIPTLQIIQLNTTRDLDMWLSDMKNHEHAVARLRDDRIRIMTNRTRVMDGGEKAGEQLCMWVKTHPVWYSVPCMVYCNRTEDVKHLQSDDHRVYVTNNIQHVVKFCSDQ